MQIFSCNAILHSVCAWFVLLLNTSGLYPYCVGSPYRDWWNDIIASLSPCQLRWRHNNDDSVSNHQPHDCLLNCLFGRTSKKTSKPRVTGLTGEFPAQMASNAENVSIWWRHHPVTRPRRMSQCITQLHTDQQYSHSKTKHKCTYVHIIWNTLCSRTNVFKQWKLELIANIRRWFTLTTQCFVHWFYLLWLAISLRKGSYIHPVW